MSARPSPREFATKKDAEDRLRDSLRRTLRDLEKAKASKAELVEAVYQAAKDAAESIDVPPVPAPKPDKRKQEGETAIAVLSDWQLGKSTPTYSSAICRKRIEAYADKVLKLTAIQRADHPVRDLRVYLLGDLCEGEQIFPGQSFRIDASLFRQTVQEGPSILSNFLRRMKSEFETVRVVGVIGNHGAIGGRARKEYHPESNGDSILMEVAKLLTEKDGIEWASNMTPNERHWYAVDRIGDHGFLLYHGDQVRGGFAGHPWYGFSKKLLGWRTSGRLPPFNYALSGHFHTPNRMYLNGLTNWGNGSTESDNTYALEELAASGEPCQWLLFAHPRKGVSAEYLVHLGDV